MKARHSIYGLPRIALKKLMSFSPWFHWPTPGGAFQLDKEGER
jgi:hypothetical protein